MTTPVKIILIVACVCLADCRLREKFHKHLLSSLEHSRTEEKNTNADAEYKVAAIEKIDGNHIVLSEAKTGYDADAIVFPIDDVKIYPDINKIVSKITDTTFLNTHVNEQDSTSNIQNDDAVPNPIISKVVPAIQAKEVFTNPMVFKDKEVAVEDKENIQTSSKQTEDTIEIKTTIDNDNTIAKNENITPDNIEIKSNDTLNSNETVPDFSSRFGVTGNYMLVPVNNAQTYQPVQTVSSPVSNVQGTQPYLVNSGQSNTIPLATNIGVNTQQANVASNNGNNPQYMSPNSNVITNMYATPNANQIVANNANQIVANNLNYNGNLAVAQGNGNYVPINVPNTYVINGQLYAAVTVPSNVNVPDSLYFVNPQMSGYQVANNLPLYKLVTVDQAGNHVLNNAQFVQ